MNNNEYHYHPSREQRDRIIRSAIKRRLIKVALERAPGSQHHYVIGVSKPW